MNINEYNNDIFVLIHHYSEHIYIICVSICNIHLRAIDVSIYANNTTIHHVRDLRSDRSPVRSRNWNFGYSHWACWLLNMVCLIARGMSCVLAFPMGRTLIFAQDLLVHVEKVDLKISYLVGV